MSPKTGLFSTFRLYHHLPQIPNTVIITCQVPNYEKFQLNLSQNRLALLCKPILTTQTIKNRRKLEYACKENMNLGKK